MNVLIPKRIQKLFWDVDLSRATDRIVIERVLNYGTLADWRWLVETYGRDCVRKAAESRGVFGRTNIRPQSARLASLLVR